MDLNLASCPVCACGAMAPSGQVISVPEQLRRWETLGSIRFPDALKRRFSAPEFAAVERMDCVRCDFGEFRPLADGDQDFYAEIERSGYYNVDKWEFRKALADLQSHGVKSLLDVGCGSGAFLDSACSAKGLGRGLATFGFDLNPESVDILMKKGHRGLSSSREKLGEATASFGTFDAVSVFQTLEHVAQPLEFLRHFSELVNSGGLLLLSTPDARGPIAHFQDALTELPPHHVGRWSRRTFEHLLPRLGFELLEIAIEPLPDYLWDSYLPAMWRDDIWPAKEIARDPENAALTPLEAAGLFIAQAKARGLRELVGVPGHTIYARARRL